MSRQNLIQKYLKLRSVNVLKYPCIPSQSRSSLVAYSKSCILSCKRNKYSQTCFPYISPLNFHASTKCLDDVKSLPVEDPNQPFVKLTFINPDGGEIEIDGRVGLTVMQEAIKNNLPLEAACDGQLACTTCHVYVEECIRKDSGTENPYLENKDEEEEDLLDRAPFCKPNSRLSCQLVISPDFHNVRFRLPAATVNFSVDKRKEQDNG